MPNQPVGHKATIAASNNTLALLVYIALFQQGIHPGQDIQGIFDSPGSSDRQGELSTITRASARIRVEYYIAAGCKYLHFMEKAIAVLAVWPAMNLYNHRVLLRRIEIMRFENPAIYWPAINAGVWHVLRCNKRDLFNKRVVEAGNAPQFAWGGCCTGEKFSHVCRVFDEQSQVSSGVIDAEITHINIARCQR